MNFPREYNFPCLLVDVCMCPEWCIVIRVHRALKDTYSYRVGIVVPYRTRETITLFPGMRNDGFPLNAGHVNDNEVTENFWIRCSFGINFGHLRLLPETAGWTAGRRGRFESRSRSIR